MRRSIVVLTATTLLGGSLLSAQAPGARPPAGPPPAGPGEIRGSVVEATGNTPIARASVAVRVNGQPAIVAGAIAGTDGAFRMQGLRPGVYSLRVTYLGFAPKLQEVTITPTALVANLGSITLSRVAVTLEGVSVKEERDAVTIEPDRNSYRAKAIAPAASNASEVLEATPAVQVDGDGKVSLRGNENVAVQINGRPSPIRGTQLGAYLKSLPANIVERIEVVPNPSARYDPEGMAGIINIVLKSTVDLGVSGGLNGGYANAERYNASGNLGYQSGPVTLFSTLGYNNDTRGVIGINDRERLDALRAPVSFTEQDIDGDQANRGLNATASMDYKLNGRDVLSNALALNRRRGEDASLMAYSELSGSRALTSKYDRSRSMKASGMMVDYTLAFKRTFEARKHELSTEIRMNRSHDEDATTLWRFPNAGSTTSRMEGQVDDTDALTKTLNAQLDYTRTLAARTKLETGFKGTGRWLDREFNVTKDSLGTGTWARSPLSNDFEFDERVQAVYGVLSHGIGKWELQGGLRGEHASRDFQLASERYPFSYNSLFPSGVAMYNVNQSTQVKASYSRRIRRPGTQELNPFPTFFDVQNVFIGNPALAPEYTDAVELGASKMGKFGSIQFAPFYRYTKDIIRVDIDTEGRIDGRDVTTVSFKNLATSNSWGADVNGNLRLGPKFQGFAGFNVFRQVTDGGSTSALGSDAVTWMGRINGTSELTKTVSVSGFYMYRAPMKIERGEFSAFQMTNLSIRKKLMGDKASVTLRASDPFHTGRFKVKAGNDTMIQLTERQFGAHAYFLNFQYTYGQQPRVRQPQQQPQEGGGGFPAGG